jgi:hypothetical protein
LIDQQEGRAALFGHDNLTCHLLVPAATKDAAMEWKMPGFVGFELDAGEKKLMVDGRVENEMISTRMTMFSMFAVLLLTFSAENSQLLRLGSTRHR